MPSAEQIELSFPIDDELVEPMEDYFTEIADCRWGLMQKDPWDPYEIIGYFPDDATADVAEGALRARFPTLSGDFTRRAIADADWQNAYKAFVQPWSHERLHWIPLWEREQITAPADAAVVYLDAGMAFGTGSHETTRLCARRLWDEQQRLAAAGIDPATQRVIDAGCGSGVLALSALALGFRDVYAFDYDPDAIQVCHENEAANSHLPAKARYAVADLAEGLRGRKADLLLANIQTAVLIPEVEHIVRATHPGTRLALSGILHFEVDSVRDCFLDAFHKLYGNYPCSDSRRDGDWCDLLLVAKDG